VSANIDGCSEDEALSSTDTFLISWSEQLAALTVQHAVPTIFQFREFAAAGGLMSYGGSNTDLYHQAGIYTGQISQGRETG
jgi:putative ABC transport system substrate-binding protein